MFQDEHTELNFWTIYFTNLGKSCRRWVRKHWKLPLYAVCILYVFICFFTSIYLLPRAALYIIVTKITLVVQPPQNIHIPQCIYLIQLISDEINLNNVMSVYLLRNWLSMSVSLSISLEICAHRDSYSWFSCESDYLVLILFYILVSAVGVNDSLEN